MKILSTEQVVIMLEYLAFKTQMIQHAQSYNQDTGQLVNELHAYINHRIKTIDKHAIETNEFFSPKEIA